MGSVRRGLAIAFTALCAPLLAASAAAAGSLPTVKSGKRPGPPLLYAKPPAAPQLSLQEPFTASPLLVSGTDALRRGEYLYQDYLFDDRGANTVPGSGSRAQPGSDIASPTAGDTLYPRAERFANNAADLVELRVKPTPTDIVYRVTLNTVKGADVSVVGIGIDTDRGGAVPVAWPGGAGLTTPGLDRFITAWGSGGEVSGQPVGAALTARTPLPSGAVSIDTTTNQMTIRVPRTLMDPGGATWRFVAGVGLFAGEAAGPGRRFLPVETRSDSTAEQPASGSSLRSAPAVFNLAFRFDEPRGFLGTAYDTFPGVGNWFEDKQAQTLAGRTTGDFRADIDFARLAAGASQDLHAAGTGEQARIFASSLKVPEGVKRTSTSSPEGAADSETFPGYGGQLQPYLLTVPPGYRSDRPAGLTFTLHSLGGTYTQYSVFSPNQLRQFGDQRGNLVVSPLARGTDGWYTDEAEADVFEVWADVARHFNLDSERVALTGYSMGGYGTYKLGVEYPDLFGRAYTTVGPPGRGIWFPPGPPTSGEDTNTNPLLENVRWIPYMNWVQAADQLVPYVGPREQQQGLTRGHGFDNLGLRSELWTFTGGEHFTLAVLDEWSAARDFLGNARVTRDPSRVDYAFFPAADRPKLGLVHDHAYWVSGLRVRDAAGDPDEDPARGEINARSLAFGEGDPTVERFRSTGSFSGPQPPPQVEGTRWTGVPKVPARNRLTLALENIRSATVDGLRARLRGSRALRVRLASDGAGSLRLNIPLRRGTRVRRVEGGPLTGAAAGAAGAPAPEVTVNRRGATFTVGAGTREYLISPPARSGGPRGGGGPGRGGSSPRGGRRDSRCAHQRNHQRRSDRDRQRCRRVGVA